jgi:hypothetical protein
MKTPAPDTLTPNDKAVLRVFRDFLMTTGQMLCFYGNDLDRHKPALASMTERRLLNAERFPGGYSLTPSGFEAMQKL